MRNILKAIFKTGSASIICILLGTVSTKIMAVVLGPNGIGLLSLIRQTLQTATTVGTMGGQTAFVQGLASKEDQEKDLYIITVFWIFILGAISISIIILLFAPWIAGKVFAANDLKTVNLVRWTVLPLLLTIIYSYLTSVLNGFRAIGRLAIGEVILSIVTAFLAYPISKLVSSGYIIAFIWMISASLLVGIAYYIIIVYKEKWLQPLVDNFKPHFDINAIKHFYYISGATLITGLTTTGTLLAIRTLIVQYNGFSSAGIFDVAWVLSMTYVMLLLNSFGTYYLPTLSKIKDTSIKIELVHNFFKVVVLLAVPIITTVIVLKPLVIHLLYTNEFTPALRIIRWMLIGDYFKITSWVLFMPMLAYAEMKHFLWTEILWNMGFLVFSVVAIFYYKDLQGIGVAFVAIYLMYLIYGIFYIYSKHKVNLLNRIFVHWLFGFFLIILVSWQTWSNIDVNWISAPIWIGIAIGLSSITLKKEELKELMFIICRRKGKTDQ